MQFTGQNTNGLAGAFPGFDSIEAGPPFNRNELYQLWYRQSLFDDKLIFRIGKSVPTFDFNNVVRPVPVGDPAAAIPAVTALAYTPIFVNPTMLGVIPGYYNSATGITDHLAPTRVDLSELWLLRRQPRPSDTRLACQAPASTVTTSTSESSATAIASVRSASPAISGWVSGVRPANWTTSRVATTNGAVGMYLFGAQRLWFRNPGVDSSGISGFYQYRRQ